jgi:hypothetical protein
MMMRYANTGGDSGVFAYEIAMDSIAVEFTDGALYLYTYASTGEPDIEQMKSLAQRGRGLNSFISRFVRKRYARRVR